MPVTLQSSVLDHSISLFSNKWKHFNSRIHNFKAVSSFRVWRKDTRRDLKGFSGALLFREMQTLTFGVKKRGNISIISRFHFKTLYFYHNGLQTSPPRIFQLGSEEKQGVRCSRSCCSPSSARMSALAEIVEDKFPHGRIYFPSKLNAGLFFNPNLWEKAISGLSLLLPCEQRVFPLPNIPANLGVWSHSLFSWYFRTFSKVSRVDTTHIQGLPWQQQSF